MKTMLSGDWPTKDFHFDNFAKQDKSVVSSKVFFSNSSIMSCASRKEMFTLQIR